jgi:hypothetical protein
MSFSKEFRHTNLAPRPKSAREPSVLPTGHEPVRAGRFAQFVIHSPPSAPQWAPIDTKEST